MDKKHEKTWIQIPESEIICNEAELVKKEIFYMKDVDTCFIIAEIDFNTNINVGSIVTIILPQFEKWDYAPCENSVIVRRDNTANTFVKMRFSPGKLELTSFPFIPGSFYEHNLQFFFRLRGHESCSSRLSRSLC